LIYKSKFSIDLYKKGIFDYLSALNNSLALSR